jgi:lipoate---protein ligase
MKAEWRYVSSDGVTAARGLATDESLMAGYARGEPDRPPILRLYTYVSHCALVGRYQNVEAEVDLDECARTGTSVNRRPTGGGAIVMGADQLGVAVIGRAPAAERPKETLQRMSEGIVRGLAELGISANFRGKNDLEVGGRKIAGLGLYLDGRGGMLFHSSVLADLDIGYMLQVLRIPAAKLGDRAVTAVGERVTTVTRESDTTWSGAGLRDIVAIGFEKALGVVLTASAATTEEEAAIDELERAKYEDQAWVHQRSPSPDAKGSALFKTAAGLVRVYLALEGGAIKSVLFTGDFNELPDELLKLESALRWSRIERVESIVETACGIHAEIPARSVIAAVLEAAERASERTVSAPQRDGSCYFPEVR